jgi:LIVCS family branched-chain amino acid:cation transporter
MLIYPLAITLTILAIFDKAFKGSKYVYICVTVLTAVPAVFDFFKALGVSSVTELGNKIFPFYDLGLGWVVPALAGLVIGIILTIALKGKANKAAA